MYLEKISCSLSKSAGLPIANSISRSNMKLIFGSRHRSGFLPSDSTELYGLPAVSLKAKALMSSAPYLKMLVAHMSLGYPFRGGS